MLTMALLVPTTMHQHNLMVEINNDVTIDEYRCIWKTFRVIIDASEGLGSTAELMEFAKG